MASFTVSRPLKEVEADGRPSEKVAMSDSLAAGCREMVNERVVARLDLRADVTKWLGRYESSLQGRAFIRHCLTLNSLLPASKNHSGALLLVDEPLQ